VKSVLSPHARLAVASSLALLASLNGQACAQTGQYPLNIHPQDLDGALIALSQSTNTSIGGIAPKACKAPPTALKGRYSVDAALRKLLDKSQCIAEPAGNGIWRLKIRPAATPAKPQPSAQSITVTATRSPQSVLTGGMIADNDSSLDALAPRVAGLLLTDRGPGRDKMFLRGLTDSILTGRTQATVGLYLDNAPIIYNAPNPDLLMIDLNSVEVLKGPQGALYGEGSVSGVLRLVANKPNLKLPGVNLGLGYGENAEGEPSRRQQVIINQPLITDRLAVRLTAYHDLSGGYLHHAYENARASNTSRRDGGRMSLLWRVNTQWQLSYGLTSQSIDSRDSQYVSNDVSAPNLSLTRTLLIREPNHSDFLNNALTLERKGPEGTLTVTLNGLRHKTRSRLDAHDIAAYVDAPSTGFVVYDEISSIFLKTQEVNFVSARQARLRYMAGVFASQSEEDFAPVLTDLVSSTRFYEETRHDDLSTTALYGELSYDLAPRWTLTVGLRTARTMLSTRSEARERLFANVKQTPKAYGLTSENTSHQVNLSYRPDKNSVIYLLSSDGYRTGGFNTSMLTVTGPVPRTYKGDYLRSLEAGWKLQSPDERLSLRLAAFHLISLNTQSDQLQMSGLPVTINLGTGSNNGLEVESDWSVTDDLRLHAAAQFNDARLDQPNTAFIKAKNANMPLVASSSFSLSADWYRRSELVPLWGTATVAYRGKSQLNLGGRDVPVMGGYTTLDLTLSARLPKARLSLSLDNATNARGNSFAYGNPFSLSIASQSTPLRPRTWWAMTRVNF
jgi:iron complex outermembrane recepter protein